MLLLTAAAKEIHTKLTILPRRPASAGDPPGSWYRRSSSSFGHQGSSEAVPEVQSRACSCSSLLQGEAAACIGTAWSHLNVAICYTRASP